MYFQADIGRTDIGLAMTVGHILSTVSAVNVLACTFVLVRGSAKMDPSNATETSEYEFMKSRKHILE